MIFDLVIDLEYDYVQDPIHCGIKLNNKSLYEGILDRNKFHFLCESTGDNTLQIHMYNKPINGTLIDKDNSIIKDTFIKIKNIEIDKRRLKYAVVDCGCTIDNQGITQNSNFISKNGYYQIKFSTPIKTFLQDYYNKFDNYKIIDVEKEIQQLEEMLDSLG